jgi:hypothetical protein
MLRLRLVIQNEKWKERRVVLFNFVVLSIDEASFVSVRHINFVKSVRAI